MKTFNEFQIEKEKENIINLICDLGIDPDVYFESILEEGIFKNIGDWWKRNVTSPNVVRLQTTYDKAKQAMDDFVKNFMSLRKQGFVSKELGGTGLYHAIADINKNLTFIKDHVAQLDQAAQQKVMGTPYADIKNWDNTSGVNVGKGLAKGWQKTEPARQAISRGLERGMHSLGSLGRQYPAVN